MSNGEYQKGNILVSSLLVLVVMNLLGAGLLQTSARESEMASFKVIDSEVFHITESCAHDVITYFEDLTGTPSSVDDVSVTELDFMYTGSETTAQLKKLENYSYSCITTYITSKNVSSGTSVGGEVGGAGGEYGSSGGTILKDYYQIVSTGAGPNNSTKVINTLISVAY